MVECVPLNITICGEFLKPLLLESEGFSKKVKDGTMDNPQETEENHNIGLRSMG